MTGPSFVASARGALDVPGSAVVIATPAAARIGDLLVALVSHNAADVRGATPAGWTLGATLGSGADVLDVYARVLDAAEPTSTAFRYRTAASELQGELVVLRGAAPATFLEASATTTFAATSALPAAGVTSQQAINLLLAVWTCSGALTTLSSPVGFASIDTFTTSAVSPRSMLIGLRRAGATGALLLPAASASIPTTGRAFTIAIRDRIPVTPGVLVDLVPGNLGLIGRDTRPAR
ncbi:MAG: hypothetical protein H7138_24000 [Myxococcales bacterium]|nr:hypothetical protein [Myxococcales bacterium]